MSILLTPSLPDPEIQEIAEAGKRIAARLQERLEAVAAGRRVMSSKSPLDPDSLEVQRLADLARTPNGHRP